MDKYILPELESIVYDYLVYPIESYNYWDFKTMPKILSNKLLRQLSLLLKVDKKELKIKDLEDYNKAQNAREPISKAIRTENIKIIDHYIDLLEDYSLEDIDLVIRALFDTLNTKVRDYVLLMYPDLIIPFLEFSIKNSSRSRVYYILRLVNLTDIEKRNIIRDSIDWMTSPSVLDLLLYEFEDVLTPEFLNRLLNITVRVEDDELSDVLIDHGASHHVYDNIKYGYRSD